LPSTTGLAASAPIALDCPVRLLHGMRHTSVPWQTSLRLAENLISQDVTVTLVKGGDHRLSIAPDLARLARTIVTLRREPSCGL
jgi:alpha-beta hydrolase superfamily lysophospholipase